VAFRLQKHTFPLQKLHFVYKYSVVELQNCISFYKIASRFTIEHYALYNVEKMTN